MNRDLAIKDIIGHFMQDEHDGVLRFGEIDERLYRSCVAEYGYGKLADDAEVRDGVIAGIDALTFVPAGTELVVTAKHRYYDESTLRGIFAMLEKKADLEVFQYDVILSILSDQIAPLIIGSGSIMTLFAYHAVRKLVEDMRNKKSQAQEMDKPTSMEEDTSYPILDSPTYSSNKKSFNQIFDEEDARNKLKKSTSLSNDQLEEVGEGLSERAHEKWMEREKAKGNGDNPNMVPYEELAEGDKESDRDYAHEFMELLTENGFDVVPQEQ